MAAPSVSGNTISWPNDGWYQVQDNNTYEQICAGTRSCTVEAGRYLVINHSTGERFEGIVVSDFARAERVGVTGNVISWPNDGWYQVQDELTYAEVCSGGRSCVVEPGRYIVINHTTGERFSGITVEDNVGHASSSITVAGNTIHWPDDGWYQVQDQATQAQVCAGGRSCTVAAGRYIVINHSSGMRWEDILVGQSDRSLPESVQAQLELLADKTFRISWQPSPAAEYYRVLENADGLSGFTQISAELEPSRQTFDHRVALFRRVNAQYIVQACNASGCVDSEIQRVSGSLEKSIVYFKASNTDVERDYFGSQVSLSADGNILAVAAVYENSAATGVNGNQDDNSVYFSGAVYVFERRNARWQQQAFLKASNTGREDYFGYALSLSDDGQTLAIGAHAEASAATGINGNQDDDSIRFAGAVYVFSQNSGSWQQQAYLKASNADEGDLFGESLSLSSDGNTLAVGASSEDSAASGINGNQHDNTAPNAGAVYVFVRREEDWHQQSYIKASNADKRDYFGREVSLSADGNTLAVGADSEDSAATGINGMQGDNSVRGSGAVYVFARSNGDWLQQAYLKADVIGVSDQFGFEVSLSGDGNTLAVGTEYEDSGATGVNGDSADNSADSAGAVYIFARNDGSWQQQAYLKASNTDAVDVFGRELSLSADGNSLAVGAAGEDSIARGINGRQDDNSAESAGAVYVFTRSSGNWRQQAYLKASNTDERDYFGTAVSLSADGHTLAVGAGGESSAATGIDGDQEDNTFSASGAVYLY